MRDLIGRYRGSNFGFVWSLLHPLLLLGVYTLVFTQIFQVRWGVTPAGETTGFAIILFTGLIAFNLFSECTNRAPTLILENAGYVKKVVFPLEILPWVTIISALFHTTVSLAVLLLFNLLLTGDLHWTIIFAPVLIAALVLIILGLLWLLASLGVFLRDINQIIGVLITALLFLSPVFYPLSAVGEDLRWLFYLNPLTFIIEQLRAVLLWGQLPNWIGLAVYFTAASSIAWLGFAWFQKTRHGFADVI